MKLNLLLSSALVLGISSVSFLNDAEAYYDRDMKALRVVAQDVPLQLSDQEKRDVHKLHPEAAAVERK